MKAALAVNTWSLIPNLGSGSRIRSVVDRKYYSALRATPGLLWGLSQEMIV